jgi:DNA polymerase-3 subunit gamma/tau
VAQALANAIEIGREPHTVIFSGVRGIGKTTSARLYAKALNCEEGASTDPCNECHSCKAINQGSHEDVMEIDGASNTGINDVRALQETINYAPQRSRFKVYIIDEVHMLSNQAFNGLLKTLEEPPAHVVFVFATTELHKVPKTISSRMPTFFLRKISTKLIKQRLQEILDAEGLPYQDNALAIVAREGHGSMRDALTLLDQAIALGNGSISMEGLGNLVSNISTQAYLGILSALVQRDGAAVLEIMNQFDQNGADFSEVAEEIARLARHGFIAKDLGAESLDVDLLGLDDAELKELLAITEQAKPFDLNRIFRTLVKCLPDLSGTTLDRFILENYLLEWCFDPGLPNLDALLSGKFANSSSQNNHTGGASGPKEAKSGLLSQAMAELKASKQPKQPATPTPKTPSTETSQATPVEQQAQPREKVFPPTWRKLVDAWKIHKPLAARKLEEAHAVEYSPAGIKLVVSDSGFAKTLLKPEEQNNIRQIFADLFGFQGTLRVIPKENLAASVAEEVSVPAPPPAKPLPDTILQTRDKETEERRQQREAAAKSSPFTKEALHQFGASVDRVVMHEDLGLGPQ